MNSRFSLKKLPPTENVSLELMGEFTDWFLSLPRDGSFMCFHFVTTCEEIQKAHNLREKRKKFIEMINHLSEIEARREYFGKEIDFRDWDIGVVALPSGSEDVIEKCPVCEKNGVVLKPYPASGFKGQTLHVIIPFAMGLESKVVCDHGMPTKVREVIKE